MTNKSIKKGQEILMQDFKKWEEQKLRDMELKSEMEAWEEGDEYNE